MEKVTVHIPATIANLVCGYDILGLAVNDLYDEMEVSLSQKPGIHITHLDDFNLPVDPDKNISGVSLTALMKDADKDVGFDLVIKKNIKPGSGLGSSAAAAAGSVVAANHLLGNIYSKAQLTKFAMKGECLASGVEHADNVAPCIYGGITLIKCLSPLDIIPIHSPELFISIIHPQIEVKTSDARAILPTYIPLQSAIKQWANIAGLIAGFYQQDYELIGRSLTDHIVEPVRSMLIPFYDNMKKDCLAAGALGGGIAGAGPTVFMLSKTAAIAGEVEKMMQLNYQNSGIDYHTHVTTLNNEGVKIIS